MTLSMNPDTSEICPAAGNAQAAMLGAWYGAHCEVRRLWAFEEAGFVYVVVKIEPTPDGYDALPVWLANSRRWTRELTSQLQRTVQMEMLGALAGTHGLLHARGIVLAEIAWREEYCR